MFARDDATKQVSMLFFLIYYCMSVVFVNTRKARKAYLQSSNNLGQH